MTVTDVRIRKVFDSGPLKAIASVTFDGEFAVHDVKVIFAREKLFVIMPNRVGPDGTRRDIAHPIVPSFREALETAVLAAYEEQKETVAANAAEYRRANSASTEGE